MDGKRFGLGLAAGLLLALTVITASGGLASPFGLYGTFGSQLASNPASSTYTAAFTLTSTSVSASSSTSGPPPVFDGGVSNKTTSTATSVATSTASTSGQKDLDQQSAGSAANSSPAYSSKLASIAQQPVLSNAVVFVPVLVAFLLGAILFRASNRRKEESGEAPTRIPES